VQDAQQALSRRCGDLGKYEMVGRTRLQEQRNIVDPVTGQHDRENTFRPLLVIRVVKLAQQPHFRLEAEVKARVVLSVADQAAAF
jgi:hypothetical protein